MHANLELLESRKLLSAEPTFSIRRGTLFVDGTPSADHIVISRQDDLTLGRGFNAANVIAADGVVNVITTTGVGVSTSSGRGAVSGPSIRGTPSRDFPVGPFFRIETQGGLTFVPILAVSAMQVDAGAGNDFVELKKDVALRSTLIGSRGDDTLAGSTRDDTLSGGAGDDLLFGGAGSAHDTFDAGTGEDTIARYTGGSVVSAGRNTATDSHGQELLVGRFNQLQDVLDQFDRQGSD